MNTEHHSSGSAELLADTEGRAPAGSERKTRPFAVFAASIALLMGGGTIAIMVTNWAVISYLAAFFGLIWWQRRSVRASPRGSGRTYVWGVAGSSVMVLVVIIGLNVLRTTVGLPTWGYVVGGLLVAAPGLVSSALIARRDQPGEDDVIA